MLNPAATGDSAEEETPDTPSARLVTHPPPGGVDGCLNHPGVNATAERWADLSFASLRSRAHEVLADSKAELVGWVSVLFAGVVVEATAELYPESHRGSLAAAISAPVPPVNHLSRSPPRKRFKYSH